MKKIPLALHIAKRWSSNAVPIELLDSAESNQLPLHEVSGEMLRIFEEAQAVGLLRCRRSLAWLPLPTKAVDPAEDLDGDYIYCLHKDWDPQLLQLVSEELLDSFMQMLATMSDKSKEVAEEDEDSEEFQVENLGRGLEAVKHGPLALPECCTTEDISTTTTFFLAARRDPRTYEVLWEEQHLQETYPWGSLCWIAVSADNPTDGTELEEMLSDPRFISLLWEDSISGRRWYQYAWGMDDPPTLLAGPPRPVELRMANWSHADGKAEEPDIDEPEQEDADAPDDTE